MHFQNNIVRSRPAKRRPGRPRKDSSQRQIVVSKTQPWNESTTLDLDTEQSNNPQSQSLLRDDSIYGQLLLKSQSPIQTEPLQLIMTNSIRIKREMLDSNPEDVTVEQVLDLRKSNNKEKTCTWCGKTGDFQEKGAHKDFCSDICFDQYRRDSFKKRSACIWCSSTSAQQFILSSANVDESKFCSPQCLAQFKVRVFCEETSAHLDQLKDVNLPDGIKDLITPELWLHNSSNGSGKRSASSLNGTSEGLYPSPTVGGQSAGGILTALSSVSPSLSSSSGGKTIGPRSILSTQGGSTGTSSSPSSFVSQTLGGLGSTQATSILGGAPLRKRGRTVAKSTVTSQQRSPNENLSTRAGNPNPSSLLHSPPILNFSTALREKHSRFNARRGGGGVGGVGTNSSTMSMSVSAALQNPMISSFPGINSSMMNKTFPLTGFPFAPPFPHQSPNSRFHMETGGMNSTRQDGGGGGTHPVSNSSLLSPSTKIPIPLPVQVPAPVPADRKHSLKSPSYMGSQSDKTERSHTSHLGSSLASLAGLFSSESFLSHSFPPITMLVPIPLPIPIPIPIPIPVILNSNFMKNRNSRKSENTSNKGGGIDLLISCSDNNNTDPSNANNTKTNNSGRDSSDNGRCDKLKIRGQIIDVDEND